MSGSGIDSQIDQISVSILATEELAESTESLSYLVLFRLHICPSSYTSLAESEAKVFFLYTAKDKGLLPKIS